MRRAELGVLPVLLLATGGCGGGGTAVVSDPNPVPYTAGVEIPIVRQPGSSPLVSLRFLFNTGAAYDPPGKEGLASLTAAMLAEGGTETLSYQEIVEAMYPMATSLLWQVDKEMTVFSGTTHVDNLYEYYDLVRRMLVNPGFREEDFRRVKDDAVNFLRVTLREGNDEELGKEQLYNVIYEGHPYGHHNRGTLSGLESITLDDVRDFYRRNFTQSNLVIGIAGGYPDGFAQKIQSDFSALSVGQPSGAEFAMPRLDPGMEIYIVPRDTRSTAISLGFPIAVNRAHPDWPALALVASYFGQHRSSNSYLYQRLREARGLNYGDYAYIEYFPRGMFQFTPDPNLGRQQQIFQIWIRPVEPEHGLFTLRATLYEYDKLIREGLSRADFEATRDFLLKYADVLTATQDARLGYALDASYYETPEYKEHLATTFRNLTLEQVNDAIRRHLAPGIMRVVIITGTAEAQALRDAIVSGAPSPITYNSPKPPEIVEEDRVIQAYPIPVEAEDVHIVPLERVFE